MRKTTSNDAPTPATFGDFVTYVYDKYGVLDGVKVIRRAVESHALEFSGELRVKIVERFSQT